MRRKAAQPDFAVCTAVYHSSKDFCDCFWEERLVYNQVPWPKPVSRPPHKPDSSEGKADGQLDRASVKERGLPVHHRSFRRTGKTLPHLDQMRRPYEVWCSSRHVFFQWTEDRFFQSTHSVGMHLDAGGIQAHYIHFYLNDSQLL